MDDCETYEAAIQKIYKQRANENAQQRLFTRHLLVATNRNLANV